MKSINRLDIDEKLLNISFNKNIKLKNKVWNGIGRKRKLTIIEFVLEKIEDEMFMATNPKHHSIRNLLQF